MLTPENLLPQKQIQKLVVLLNMGSSSVLSSQTLPSDSNAKWWSCHQWKGLDSFGEKIGTGESKEGQALMRKTFYSRLEYLLESSDSAEVLLAMYKGFSLPYSVSWSNNCIMFFALHR